MPKTRLTTYEEKIAKRYARIIFDLAQEEKHLEKIAHDFQQLVSLTREVAEFRMLCSNPAIATQRKKAILKELFDKHLHPQALKFILFLVDKDRLDLLAGIAEAFAKFYLAHQGILEVQMTVAQPPDAAFLQQTKKILGSKFNKAIQLHPQVDPQLLGGFKLQVANTIYDTSLRSQLEKYKTAVLAA